MGIRINKVLGYGTDTIVKDEYQINDPRFDRDGFEAGGWTFDIEANEEAILKAFAEEYDKAEPEEVLKNVKRDWKHRDKGDDMKLKWEFEFSDIPALVFVLPGCKDWIRYDDIIDYYDSGRGSENRFRYLEGAGYIWPYYGRVRRFRGDERFEWEPANLEVGHYNQMVGLWDENRSPLKSGEDLGDLRSNWRPTLPPILLAWIYCQDWIVDKPGLVNELRPCIYEYWC